jgi:hypothetical protein
MPRSGIALTCALLVILGAGVLSAQTGAMLYANGTVRVNGHDASDASSVFSGDRIQVTSSSSGSINRTGSSVVISPNSSIQYDPASVDLLQGSARVNTSKGMSVKVGELVVAPQSATAKFDVTRAGDKVVVVSREGAVTITDGGQSRIVQPGSSADLMLTGGAVSLQQASVTQTSFLAQDRLSEHPFYGVVNGVESTPGTLPVCVDVTLCIRPSVSKIRPCCCPPVVKCTSPTP